MLTELEGGVLSEIHHRGEQTAFRVRRSFAESASLEWKGSVGAVYPAIRRLERDGFLAARATGDGRATRLLSLTPRGVAALFSWACDPMRAASVGIDPFRMRAGIWLGLDVDRRREVIAEVRCALEASVAAHNAFSRNRDTIERVSVELGLRLQQVRLDWLRDLSAMADRDE
jgi:DNA-binding PadR family transcriptional regulator